MKNVLDKQINKSLLPQVLEKEIISRFGYICNQCACPWRVDRGANDSQNSEMRTNKWNLIVRVNYSWQLRLPVFAEVYGPVFAFLSDPLI